jgi:DNA-binding YbaB/EbfC family protein
MSKGHGMSRGMPNINPAALQKQVQEMQQRLLEAQQSLANETVSSTVGGGAVSVKMNGQQKVLEVKISPEALQDVEMLQDLVLAAVNDAIERSQQLASERVGAVTGGLGLPGLG